MTPEFWRGRRVLVTGHTGFKGSWLCVWLDALGAVVAGYALDPPTRPSLYERAGVAKLVEGTIADIRDQVRLTDAIREAEPQIVFHLAAQSLVLRSYDDPVETYATNVLGTVHVLEAIRQLQLPCTVVNVTSDKCYENERWPWGYRENDRIGGRDPYSSSKACAELVARAYRDSFFPLEGAGEPQVAIASARAGNVIGGGDWTPNQLVPDTIAALEAGERVRLRHPNAVRPWQHVLDCLRGYLVLAQRLHLDGARYSGEWNFGPPESDCRPVGELVETLSGLWGAKLGWEQDTAHHAKEEGELRLDSSKAAAELGWRTALPLPVALEWVVDWYRGLSRGTDVLQLCGGQVRSYEALLSAESGSAG
ncbi:MAG: CDP-glucose 4,6-dehydratase [Actinobacteria bacterium]|nr:CDP-glucose 4,6-dehydratase [Actinomycetota bacterium]